MWKFIEFKLDLLNPCISPETTQALQMNLVAERFKESNIVIKKYMLSKGEFYCAHIYNCQLPFIKMYQEKYLYF